MSIASLETSLNRCYLENKPRIHDPIWERVQSVALSPNFNHTGLLLLSCTNPSEQVIRFLPTALHAEVLEKLNKEELISQMAQSIINAVIEDPQQFKLSIFSTGFQPGSDPLKLHKHYFLSTLSDGTYKTVDRNTPGKILDYIDNSIYIRSDDPEQAMKGMQAFQSSLPIALSEIADGFKKLTERGTPNGAKTEWTIHEIDEVLSHFSRHSLVEAYLNRPDVSAQLKESTLKNLSTLAAAFKQFREKKFEQNRQGMEFLASHTNLNLEVPLELATDHPHYYWIKKENSQESRPL